MATSPIGGSTRNPRPAVHGSACVCVIGLVCAVLAGLGSRCVGDYLMSDDWMGAVSAVVVDAVAVKADEVKACAVKACWQV